MTTLSQDIVDALRLAATLGISPTATRVDLAVTAVLILTALTQRRPAHAAFLALPTAASALLACA